MDPLARLSYLGVSLGGQPVLRDVDLTVPPGRVVGIAGPNGSGKTTLIRVLATLLPIDRGSGDVLGARLGSEDIYGVRSRIGMMGHVPSLVSELSLAENLVHVARLAGVDQSRVPPVIRVVGLEAAADRRAGQSSFGMMRRIEVARALLTNPRLLLLDEAISGLDEAAQDLIGALTDRTTHGGGGVVMVSHDAAQLAKMCDVVLHLAKGRLGAGG